MQISAISTYTAPQQKKYSASLNMQKSYCAKAYSKNVSFGGNPIHTAIRKISKLKSDAEIAMLANDFAQKTEARDFRGAMRVINKVAKAKKEIRNGFVLFQQPKWHKSSMFELSLKDPKERLPRRILKIVKTLDRDIQNKFALLKNGEESSHLNSSIKRHSSKTFAKIVEFLETLDENTQTKFLLLDNGLTKDSLLHFAIKNNAEIVKIVLKYAQTFKAATQRQFFSLRNSAGQTAQMYSHERLEREIETAIKKSIASLPVTA